MFMMYFNHNFLGEKNVLKLHHKHWRAFCWLFVYRTFHNVLCDYKHF